MVLSWFLIRGRCGADRGSWSLGLTRLTEGVTPPSLSSRLSPSSIFHLPSPWNNRSRWLRNGPPPYLPPPHPLVTPLCSPTSHFPPLFMGERDSLQINPLHSSFLCASVLPSSASRRFGPGLSPDLWGRHLNPWSAVSLLVWGKLSLFL